MRRIELVVLGEPMGKQRPRATFVAGHATIYTPKKTMAYEGRFAHAYGEKYGDEPPIQGACKVSIEAVFALSKADYTSKGEPNKRGRGKLEGTIRVTKKPDCDNIAKAVLDGLNEVALMDDCQVVELTIRKSYGVQPKVAVAVTELE